MGWYSNQKARHEAHKVGEARPVTGGIGDRISTALDTKVEQAHDRQDRASAALVVEQDRRDAVKGDKANRKRDRKAARRG